jgi:hypothetical protein
VRVLPAVPGRASICSKKLAAHVTTVNSRNC